MVVPFSLTTQSLMRRPSRVEEGFGLEQTRFALAGEYQGSFGIENDRPTPPGRAEIAQLNTNEVLLGRHLIPACHHFERLDQMVADNSVLEKKLDAAQPARPPISLWTNAITCPPSALKL